MVYSNDRSKAEVPVLVFVAFLVYSTRRFVLCLTLCYFVILFFSPFSIAITWLGEESAFRKFVRFVLVWSCRFPLPFGVWEGLRLVIVTLSGLFSYIFFCFYSFCEMCVSCCVACRTFLVFFAVPFLGYVLLL